MLPFVSFVHRTLQHTCGQINTTNNLLCLKLLEEAMSSVCSSHRFHALTKHFFFFFYKKLTFIATMNMRNNLDTYFQNSTQECPTNCLTGGHKRIPISYLTYCLRNYVLLSLTQFIWRRKKTLTWQRYGKSKWPPLLLLTLLKWNVFIYLSIFQRISCNYYNLPL